MFEKIAGIFWGWHILALILAAGIYFSFFTGFLQIRRLKKWILSPFSGRGRAKSGISGFQALSTALAGSIGTGNIVGVAAAITVGGPGSLFWMWASAFFGMMTVFAENVLASKYRNAPGALGYIEKAGRWGKKLAAVYAVGCFLSSLAMGNMIQTNSAAASFEQLGIPVWICAPLLGIFLYITAAGGVSVTAKVTEKLVPFMTLLFFAAAAGVLWIFRENIPGALSSVFREAFTFKAAAGGGSVGMFMAMKTGVSRGVFTNEAGLGSSSFAYGEVKDKKPEELGYLGIFQVFTDTLVMCTVTGLCILCCRSPVLEGAELTFYAFESALGKFGSCAVSLCTALFAAATAVAWSCYGQQGLFYLTKGKGKRLSALIYSGAGALGCFMPLSAAFTLGDAFNGIMAVPNILALFYFSREIKQLSRGGKQCEIHEKKKK